MLDRMKVLDRKEGRVAWNINEELKAECRRILIQFMNH